MNVPLNVRLKVKHVTIEILLPPLLDSIKLPASMDDIISLISNPKRLVPLPDNRRDIRKTHQTLSNGTNAMSDMDL
jgi:hypothetical protein